MNCKKCNKEITDTEHTLYNTYCKECWPSIPRSERKRLEGFCSLCGHATWHAYEDAIRCGMCGRVK